MHRKHLLLTASTLALTVFFAAAAQAGTTHGTASRGTLSVSNSGNKSINKTDNDTRTTTTTSTRNDNEVKDSYNTRTNTHSVSNSGNKSINRTDNNTRTTTTTTYDNDVKDSYNDNRDQDVKAYGSSSGSAGTQNVYPTFSKDAVVSIAALKSTSTGNAVAIGHATVHNSVTLGNGAFQNYAGVSANNFNAGANASQNASVSIAAKFNDMNLGR